MTIKEQIRHCAGLSDQELWSSMPRLARQEGKDLVRFLIHLMEVKRRDLHLERAYPGLYTYLVRLGFSEWEAHARTVAVAAAEKYRSVLGLLQGGRLTLLALVLLGPHLTAENYRGLLRRACRRSRREVEALVAGLAPQACRRDVVRVVSAPSPLPVLSPQAPPAGAASGASAGAPEPGWASSCPAGGEGLFPGRDGPGRVLEAAPQGLRRLRFSFDGPEELDALLTRARGLLVHKYPGGGMGLILLDALNALLDRIDPERRIQRRLERRRRKEDARARGRAPAVRQALQPRGTATARA